MSGENLFKLDNTLLKGEQIALTKANGGHLEQLLQRKRIEKN